MRDINSIEIIGAGGGGYFGGGGGTGSGGGGGSSYSVLPTAVHSKNANSGDGRMTIRFTLCPNGNSCI